MPTTCKIITLEQTHCSWDLFPNLSKQSLVFLCSCNIHTAFSFILLSVWRAACGLFNSQTREEGRTCLGKHHPQETCPWLEGRLLADSGTFSHSPCPTKRSGEAKNHSTMLEKTEEPNVPTNSRAIRLKQSIKAMPTVASFLQVMCWRRTHVVIEPDGFQSQLCHLN